MIVVYHAKEHLTRDSGMFGISDTIYPASRALAELDGDGYELVANVESDDLNDAWYLTNNIEHHWSENAGVEPKDKHGCYRSSMVGDLFIKSNGVYIVAGCGFEKIRTFDI